MAGGSGSLQGYLYPTPCILAEIQVETRHSVLFAKSGNAQLRSAGPGVRRVPSTRYVILTGFQPLDRPASSE